MAENKRMSTTPSSVPGGILAVPDKVPVHMLFCHDSHSRTTSSSKNPQSVASAFRTPFVTVLYG